MIPGTEGVSGWAVLLELVKIVVPSGLVILGWVVVSKGNDKRETRKETRQFLDRTISSVEKVRDSALECLLSSDAAVIRKLEASIDPCLKTLEDSLMRLKLRDDSGVVITAQQVRTAITNNGFYRVANRQAVDCDHRALHDINLQVAVLIDALEKAYQGTYHK
ncbi:hypothetical protein E8E95_13795 [Pseudomonas sp. BN414]|uniref:hypothetical protein n=1 Tax=Pseudomonas sp. BN414 TaxID=2567888 RepID=UPI002454E129|nr:hypothetical protein [Pseudomonas sp. BN414]MDH4567753.1 hypothetical protein [Pseudomonas sp. BN414]